MSTTDRALYTIGVVIEGVGNDTDFSGGLAFSYGDPPGTSDYEWVQALVNPPASIDDMVNPFTGEIRTSGFDFKLANLDIVATKLLYQSARYSYVLYADMTASQTTIQLIGSHSGLGGGTVVWLDDEAVFLTSEVSNDGTKTIYNCTRGYFSTAGQAHEEGAWVYSSSPYHKQRRVQLLRYDRETGTELVKWTGYLAEDPYTDKKGVTVSLQADATLSAMQQAQINRNATKIIFAGELSDRSQTAGVSMSSTPYRIRKANEYAGSRVWLQLDDVLTSVTIISTDQANVSAKPFVAWGGPDFDYSDEERKQWEGFELLVIDGANKLNSSTSTLGPSGAWWRHPIALAIAGCISTGSSDSDGLFDCLDAAWSIGANPSWFDLDAIEAVITEYPDLRIDHLILGWDGEPLRWFDFATQVLLRPNGYYWSLTEDGLITISRLSSLAIDSYQAAVEVDILPDHLERKKGLANYNFVTALVGELPWRDPDRIDVTARDNRRSDSLRRSAFDDATALEFDLRTRRYVGDDGDIQSRLLSTVVRGYYAIPVIGVTVLDSDITEANYDLGSYISPLAEDLITAWFVDNTGTRVLLDAKAAQTTGQIIGRKYDLNNGTYELTLLLTSYRSGIAVDWRAPAAKIVSQSVDTLTVSQNYFHADTADASYFGVNDTVDIWWAEGTYAGDGSPRLVVSVSGNTIEVNSAFALLTAGQVLRLADFDTYESNHSNPISGYTDVVYAFIADDTTDTIGSDPDPGDVYG